MSRHAPEPEIPTEVLAAIEYEVDYARTHVQAALDAVEDKDRTREFAAMRLRQADELLTSAVQRLWCGFGWGKLPVGTLADQEKLEEETI